MRTCIFLDYWAKAITKLAQGEKEKKRQHNNISTVHLTAPAEEEVDEVVEEKEEGRTECSH